MSLDRWIIEKCTEPVLHFVERETGVSNFTVARFMLVVIAAVDSAAICKEPLRPMAWTGMFIDGVLIAVRLWAIARAERSTARGFSNEEKHDFGWSWCRSIVTWFAIPMCVFYLLCIILFVDWSLLPAIVWQLAMLFHYYATACDRPPPQQVREPLFGRTAMEGN